MPPPDPTRAERPNSSPASRVVDTLAPDQSGEITAIGLQLAGGRVTT